MAWLIPHLSRLGYHQEAFSIAKTLSTDSNSNVFNLPSKVRYAPRSLPSVFGRGIRPRITAFVEMSPYLSRELVEEVFNDVYTLPDRDEYGDIRLGALIGIAPYLPDSLIEKLLTSEYNVEDLERHAELIAAVAPRLPDRLLPRALAVAREISAWGSIDALVELIPYLSEPLLREVFEAMYTLSETKRAAVLAKLAPYLPKQLLREALMQVELIEDPPSRAEALVEISIQLAKFGSTSESVVAPSEISVNLVIDGQPDSSSTSHPSNNLELVSMVLALMQKIDDVYDRERELARLIARMAKAGQLQAAVTLVRELTDVRISYSDYSTRGLALSNLAPYLHEPLLRQALYLAQAIGDENSRAWTLTRLIPRLAELGHPQEAIELLHGISETASRGRSPRAEALGAIAPHLPEPELKKALAIALDMGPVGKIKAIAAMAPHLPEALLQEVLTIAQELPEIATIFNQDASKWKSQPMQRKELLQLLVPYLPESLLREALEILKKLPIGQDWHEVKQDLLRELIPYLTEPLLREVMALIKANVDETDCAEALMGIAPRLAQLGYPQEALEILQRLPERKRSRNHKSRSEALGKIVPYLTETLLREVLSTSWAHNHIATQAELACRLAERGDISEVLPVVYAIRYSETRAKVLEQIASSMASIPASELWEIWLGNEDGMNLLRVLANSNRTDFLSELCALGPVVITLGETKAVGDIVSAIQDVRGWWP